MARSRVASVLKIYTACSAPLCQVLVDLPREQLDWKPGPESRSIGERRVT